jgi:hypothetical protein
MADSGKKKRKHEGNSTHVNQRKKQNSSTSQLPSLNTEATRSSPQSASESSSLASSLQTSSLSSSSVVASESTLSSSSNQPTSLESSNARTPAFDFQPSRIFSSDTSIAEGEVLTVCQAVAYHAKKYDFYEDRPLTPAEIRDACSKFAGILKNHGDQKTRDGTRILYDSYGEYGQKGEITEVVYQLRPPLDQCHLLQMTEFISTGIGTGFYPKIFVMSGENLGLLTLDYGKRSTLLFLKTLILFQEEL